jgi:hypothetical protein
MHRGDKKCIKKLAKKSEGKRSLGKPRHRWEENTEMDPKEMNCEAVYWTEASHLLW